jgi:hypothetical protein
MDAKQFQSSICWLACQKARDQGYAARFKQTPRESNPYAAPEPMHGWPSVDFGDPATAWWAGYDEADEAITWRRAKVGAIAHLASLARAH